MSPVVKYTLIRLGLFAVALAIFLVVGVPGWVSAILAAVVAFCVAYIFFRPQRDELVRSVTAKRASGDEAAEDDDPADDGAADAADEDAR